VSRSSTLGAVLSRRSAGSRNRKEHRMLPTQAELDIAAYTLAATISNLEDFASRLQSR